MKLGGKEYQPVTPTGQRCKEWRVDLDGQWRQHHGTSKFVWSFRRVRLNTGIAHFFFFFSVQALIESLLTILHSVRQTGVSTCPLPVWARGSADAVSSGSKTGTSTREGLQGTVQGEHCAFQEGWRRAGRAGAGEIAGSGWMAWATDAPGRRGCLGFSEKTHLLLLPQLSPANVPPFMWKTIISWFRSMDGKTHYNIVK